MTTILKSAAVGLLLSVIAGGAALAAEEMSCCCKDKDGKMTCCDKMKGDHAAPQPGAQAPAAPQGGEHQDHKH